MFISVGSAASLDSKLPEIKDYLETNDWIGKTSIDFKIEQESSKF